MAKEQHDNEYGNQTILRVGILIVALMVVGVPTAFIPGIIDYGPKVSPMGWVLVSMWTLILIIGTIWVVRVQRCYHCPKCGVHLPMLRPEKSTKYQHRFYCATCDVTWTTDVYRGDS